ncbi:MAG: zf-TFIIB domain-containing protein [Planctomycetia bacterium]|nr:zf-TFIIB domain-containing protein [Planctomycetia bacterium]
MESKGFYIQKCPTCGRRMQIQVRYLGMTLTCPHCQGRFVAQDQSSIWDGADDSSDYNANLSHVIQKLETNLQRSGILS